LALSKKKEIPLEFEIFIASTDEDINLCFPVYKELRPKLNFEDLLPQVRRQEAQSYKILALRKGSEIQSVAGFRFCEFLAWGKILYIDDLSTLSSARGNGFAGELLNFLIELAKTKGCNGIHLDSGYARHTAHRLYLQKGFQLSSHHFSLEL
jgi:GNAT superfamily N-acetyltransferase